MKRATECLTFLLFASSLLLFAFVPRYDLFDDRETWADRHPARGLLDPPTDPSNSTSTSNPPTSASTPTTPAAPSTPATVSTSSTSSPLTSSSSSTSTTSTPTAQPSPSAAPVTSNVVTTNSLGNTQTVVVVTTPSQSSSPSPSAATDNTDSGGGGGLGTGSIIGLSVAGGVALICIVAFFVWKFTRKRFTDFDDNEAIKWPELNSHGGDSHALPTNATGRAGFGNESELSLSRSPSRAGYAPSVAATSTPELHAGAAADPYAVPPLPHLNPNQPYRDDPNAAGYYDPYRGPVPNTFNDISSVDTHGAPYSAEAYPMTQLAPGVRARSPGPQASYDMIGRASPQPYAGRQSPGPQAAMGYSDDRSRTPAGRRSPGPQAAYDPGFGPR